jgi:hypothetical protein
MIINTYCLRQKSGLFSLSISRVILRLVIGGGRMQKLLAAIFKVGQVSGSFLDRVINDSLLGDPTFSGDQYLEYERLLAKAPIIRMYVANGWGLLGFEAVTEALKDSRFSSMYAILLAIVFYVTFPGPRVPQGGRVPRRGTGECRGRR